MDRFTTTEGSLAAYDGRAWSLEPILHTAEHAIAVYQDAEGYADATRRAGYVGAMIVEQGAAQVGLAWSKRLIVVSARGSSQPSDWRDDLLSIVRRRWRGVLPDECRVGYGFQRQAAAIGPEIVSRIRKLQRVRLYSNARIVVTGHSLGAALVWLIVAYLRAKGLEVSFAAAHESPRVGNRNFAKRFNREFTYAATPVWSVVNVSDGQADLVTRLPKRAWGFRHAGRRVILAGDDVLFGEDAWLSHRKANPVTHRVAAWRFVTRFVRKTSASIRAHRGRSELARLRHLLRIASL